jgi:large subunit ribosomal protein L1
LTFHTAVGTTDMPPEEIADNIEQIVKRLSTKLEKGTMNIRSAFVKTTMGPSEKVI